VLEFRDIFSTELSPEPADLPPLDVPIDTAKWHQPKNQGRPRNQLVEGQQEIKRHLEKLLECGAISPVLHASAYSQVLLVSKPDTKEKRLVLDYRALTAVHNKNKAHKKHSFSKALLFDSAFWPQFL
jgi:hypothetical protein